MVCLNIFCNGLNMILELTHMTGGRYKFGVICFRLQTLDMIVVAEDFSGHPCQRRDAKVTAGPY